MRQRGLLPPPVVFLFLLPNLLGFLAFTLFPVVLSFLMAFTNWTLKPAVPLEYVGARNFTDLLGFEPLGTPAPGLLAVWMMAGAAVVAGLGTAVWAGLRGWRGARLGGVLVAAAGLVMVVAALAAGAHHGLVLTGLLAIGGGGLQVMMSEEPLRFSRGTVPAVVAMAGAGLLWALHGPATAAYAPRDHRFWYYLYNTAYLMLAIPPTVIGSLGLALLLNRDLPTGTSRERLFGAALCLALGSVAFGIFWGAGWRDAAVLGAVFWLVAAIAMLANVVTFRTVYYLPSFTAGIAIMILWKAMYNPQTGPINSLLALATGMEMKELPQWLSSGLWSKPALMIMGFWIGVGGMNMLLYLAALSNLPEELDEAAQVDGASRWQRLVHVTIPQLMPTTFFIAVMSLIGGLQGGFEQARVMTEGGPEGATTTLAYYVYTIAFQDLDLGYAAAISWIMFAIIFVATLVNWQFGRELEAD